MRAWLWPIQMLIGASPRPLSASAQGTFSRASTSPYLAIGLCPSIGDTCGVFPLTLGMSLAKKNKDEEGPLMGQTLSEVGGGAGDCGGSQMLVLWKLSM